MEIGQITLPFPGIDANTLQEKCEDAIAKFNLQAQYQDGAIMIIGPRPVLEKIAVAYQTQKMMAGGPGVYFYG